MQVLKAENERLRAELARAEARLADVELGRHRPLGESTTLRSMRRSVCISQLLTVAPLMFGRPLQHNIQRLTVYSSRKDRIAGLAECFASILRLRCYGISL